MGRTPTLQDTSDLIARGKFDDAAAQLGAFADNDEYQHDATYWFQRTLVALLHNNEERAEFCRIRGRSLPGWSDTMEGDAQRDLALHITRQRHVHRAHEARQAIETARTLFARIDANRHGSLAMAEGRLYAMTNDNELAREAYERANVLLRDPGWRTSNRFHWFLLLRGSDPLKLVLHDVRHTSTRELFREIRKQDGPKRTLIAAAFLFGGKYAHYVRRMLH